MKPQWIEKGRLSLQKPRIFQMLSRSDARTHMSVCSGVQMSMPIGPIARTANWGRSCTTQWCMVQWRPTNAATLWTRSMRPIRPTCWPLAMSSLTRDAVQLWLAVSGMWLCSPWCAKKVYPSTRPTTRRSTASEQVHRCSAQRLTSMQCRSTTTSPGCALRWLTTPPKMAV